MKPAIIALVILLALTGVAQATAGYGVPSRVAVLELVNNADLADQEVGYLGDLIRGRARQALPHDEYLIMTRENIYELLGDRSLSDCVGACAVETGRNLGAHYVVAGEILQFGESLRASLSLHETGSGNLIETMQAAGDSVEDLERALTDGGQVLFRPLHPKEAVAIVTGDVPTPVSRGGASPPPGSFSQPVGKAGWALWVYSFSRIDLATAEVHRLKTLGYEAVNRRVADGGAGTSYRIYVGSFASRTEAEAAAEDLKRRLGHDFAVAHQF